MFYLDGELVKLKYPLQSFSVAEQQGIKLPSLFKPEKLEKRHIYTWIYVGLLADCSYISRKQVKQNFKKYSMNELLEAVYTALNVNMREKGSLNKLADYMEEVN
ncbi:hypothetical protein P3T75_05780 [Enterococcus montenegrensis]|uniref:hypothetical protein n=1 Tax=Enterococcus montenegrensis TaxID=3031993 RepID=UPI00249F83FA|nr:hypothetical protein [Enterococcus montenegrensis]WHA10314.1 hypothetical protein P3T75_05780 [Enterococcus montenegrensis]